MLFLSVHACALHIIYIYAHGGTPVSRLSNYKDMKKGTEGVEAAAFVINYSFFFFVINV